MAEDHAFIAKYDGYLNLKPGQAYPEPYVTTNTRDDRVHPGHARKFAAKMEALGYPTSISRTPSAATPTTPTRR